ncbi:hypothetical protein PhCBS80983_g04162 [Powellomyces hirtus]|uniref:C3H1-type domain-containing protein n=1 Tax=Powellomyces hirtus TaxID=109895 RepID=A0A507E1J9_9FUNG|nr:hypothetical protein PhCBS80983_g04162 [Powellomyces hirtus]
MSNSASLNNDDQMVSLAERRAAILASLPPPPPDGPFAQFTNMNSSTTLSDENGWTNTHDDGSINWSNDDDKDDDVMTKIDGIAAMNAGRSRSASRDSNVVADALRNSGVFDALSAAASNFSQAWRSASTSSAASSIAELNKKIAAGSMFKLPVVGDENNQSTTAAKPNSDRAESAASVTPPALGLGSAFFALPLAKSSNTQPSPEPEQPRQSQQEEEGELEDGEISDDGMVPEDNHDNDAAGAADGGVYNIANQIMRQSDGNPSVTSLTHRHLQSLRADTSTKRKIVAYDDFAEPLPPPGKEKKSRRLKKRKRSNKKVKVEEQEGAATAAAAASPKQKKPKVKQDPSAQSEGGNAEDSSSAAAKLYGSIFGAGNQEHGSEEEVDYLAALTKKKDADEGDGTRRAAALREAKFAAKASTTPCEFWAQGKCAADTTCPFSHAGEGHALQRLPCRFFKSGSCQRGAECIWSHDLKTEPCVFHHLKQAKGGCKNGEACAFSHEPMTDQQRLVLEHEQERFEKRVLELQEAAPPSRPTSDRTETDTDDSESGSDDEEEEDEEDGYPPQQHHGRNIKMYSQSALLARGGPGYRDPSAPISKHCVFYHLKQSSGGCWKGPGCKFSHDPISKEEKDRLWEMQSEHERRHHGLPERDATNNNGHEKKGTFGAGGAANAHDRKKNDAQWGQQDSPPMQHHTPQPSQQQQQEHYQLSPMSKQHIKIENDSTLPSGQVPDNRNSPSVTAQSWAGGAEAWAASQQHPPHQQQQQSEQRQAQQERASPFVRSPAVPPSQLRSFASLGPQQKGYSQQQQQIPASLQHFQQLLQPHQQQQQQQQQPQAPSIMDSGLFQAATAFLSAMVNPGGLPALNLGMPQPPPMSMPFVPEQQQQPQQQPQLQQPFGLGMAGLPLAAAPPSDPRLNANRSQQPTTSIPPANTHTNPAAAAMMSSMSAHDFSALLQVPGAASLLENIFGGAANGAVAGNAAPNMMSGMQMQQPQLPPSQHFQQQYNQPFQSAMVPGTMMMMNPVMAQQQQPHQQQGMQFQPQPLHQQQHMTLEPQLIAPQQPQHQQQGHGTNTNAASPHLNQPNAQLDPMNPNPVANAYHHSPHQTQLYNNQQSPQLKQHFTPNRSGGAAPAPHHQHHQHQQSLHHHHHRGVGVRGGYSNNSSRGRGRGANANNADNQRTSAPYPQRGSWEGRFNGGGRGRRGQ